MTAAAKTILHHSGDIQKLEAREAEKPRSRVIRRKKHDVVHTRVYSRRIDVFCGLHSLEESFNSNNEHPALC